MQPIDINYIEIPLNQLSVDFKQEMSFSAMGRKYNVSRDTIKKRLIELGLVSAIKQKKWTRVEIPIEDVKKDFLGNMPISTIAMKYNVSRHVIYKRLEETGFKLINN